MSGISLVNFVFISLQGTQSVNLASTKAWDEFFSIPNNVGYVWSTIETIAIEDEWAYFSECGDDTWLIA
jgi:hypothetical protein